MRNMQNHIEARWMSCLAMSTGAAAALLLASSTLHADDKQVCLDAYDKAQTMRQERKLSAAREQLILCVRSVCPAMIRRDCTDWMVAVEAAMPSVVISARGPDGQDAVDVTVTVDGKPFVSQLDGKAVPLDPGVHAFRFALNGAAPVEQRTVILEGVKNRQVAVEFKVASASSSGSSSASPAPAEDTGPSTTKRPPALAYVLGGVGLVGLGGLTYFGLSFDSKLSGMDSCKPNCPQSDADSASKTRIFALVSGGVGVVSLGVSTWLFLAPRRHSSAPVSAARATTLDVLPLDGGAYGSLRGTF